MGRKNTLLHFSVCQTFSDFQYQNFTVLSPKILISFVGIVLDVCKLC